MGALGIFHKCRWGGQSEVQELGTDRKRHGTGVLTRQIEIYQELRDGARRGEHPRSPPPRAARRESLNCSKTYREEAAAGLARMIALHGYDPTIVEDSYFRSFVSLLNPDFQVPSRVAIEEICDGIFDEARRDLKSELERTSVWVNLALDTAKTVEGSVLYVACHFIDDEWNRREMIMDTYMIVPHSVHQCPLMSFWTICLEDKDHCDVVVDKMHRYDMSHKIFSKTVGTISNLKDHLGVSCHNATYLNIVLDSIAQCLYDNLDPDFIANTYNARPFYDLTREKLEELLSQLGLDDLRAYDKHWYPCYCSLQLLDKHFSWTSEFCELLSKLWGKIYHAIKTISDHNRPTSNICLRELFKVRELLQSEIAGDSGDKEDSYGPDKNVEGFLGEARDILDRSIHDSYFTWSIPLVLDPRYKLRYIIFIFDRAFGSEAEKYISEVTRKIKELFTIHSEDGGETTDDIL